MVRLVLIIFFLYNSVFAEELNKDELFYYDFLDTNNDNFITFEEINTHINLIFFLVDENNDKKISKEEIINLKKIIESLS